MSRSTQPKLNPVGPSHTVVLRPSEPPARAERRPPQRAETRRGTPDVEPAKGGPGRIYPSRRCSRRPRAVLPLQPRRRWPPTRGQYRESLAFSRGAAHEALPAKHPRATAAATTAGWGAALSTDVVRAEVSFLGPRGGRIPSFAREAPQPAQAKQPQSKARPCLRAWRRSGAGLWLHQARRRGLLLPVPARCAVRTRTVVCITRRFACLLRSSPCGH